VTWDDLLQEAITRVLVGSRRQPQGVKMVAFLAGIMRSLRAEHWRRARQGPGAAATLRIDHKRDLSKEPAALSSPAAALARVLDALEHELIDASNEEIMDAATDLGMKPMMKGSAAFMGLNYPGSARFADFFDSEMLKQMRAEVLRVASERRAALPKRETQRSKQPRAAHPAKDSDGK
jgi:hypothetical protein